MKKFLLGMLVLSLLGCSTSKSFSRFTGPWDVASLRARPTAIFGPRTNLVSEVYYTGAVSQGKPSRIFAYYARPAVGDGPFPAMLLVHGGGGKAFREWAEHWAQRGYVALAMDLAGHGPDGRLPDGGPEQSDDLKFRDFATNEANQMWTYHAVVAVLRGHALLATQPEVDPQRIGVTGISWGGYLTCIVAGIDDRLKVAVPVYGCGFLADNSVWLARFEKMNPNQRQRWVDYFDPARYLRGANCPILFLNGATDFAYPLDSYQKSYQQVKGPKTLSVQLQLPHGHIWTFGEVDAFVDHILKAGEPLPTLQPLRIAHGRAACGFTASRPLTNAVLNYTTDSGEWQKRVWKSVPAEIHADTVSAPLPRERPLVCYLAVTDQRHLTVSTEYVAIPRP